MKTFVSIALSTVLLVCCTNLIMAQQVATYEKDYSFDVSSGAKINVESSFTDVTLTTWNENRVAINVYAKTEASSVTRADRLMEDIDIEVTGSSSLIEIESRFRKGGNRNGKSEIDIRISIKAPNSLNLDFDSSFGDIVIPDWEGYCELDLQFGDLNLQDLRHESAEIEVQYSDLDLGNANNLDLTSSFSDVSIQNVNHLEIETQYDEVDVESVHTLDADSQFTDFEVGRVQKELILDTQYGAVEIDGISADFDRIEIENQFGEVKLYIDSGANYSLDVDMSFASFNFEDKSSLNYKKEGFNDEHYWGQIGTGGGSIEIDSSFGGVKIR